VCACGMDGHYPCAHAINQRHDATGQIGHSLHTRLGFHNSSDRHHQPCTVTEPHAAAAKPPGLVQLCVQPDSSTSSSQTLAG
jgi:hypothetical protein